jgi:hypothetical protein
MDEVAPSADDDFLVVSDSVSCLEAIRGGKLTNPLLLIVVSLVNRSIGAG